MDASIYFYGDFGSFKSVKWYNCLLSQLPSAIKGLVILDWLVLFEKIKLMRWKKEFWMHRLGAINSGLTIFNMSVLPVLLYNASTWFEVSKTTINKLENLQLMLQRCLLGVPASTPIPAMCCALCMIGVQHQINYMKLMFLHYVIGLDQPVLAKEIYETQKSPAWSQNHKNCSHITTYRT